MKKKTKPYLFYGYAEKWRLTDRGAVAMLTEVQVSAIYERIRLPHESEFWMVPAQTASYQQIVSAIETDVHEHEKNKVQSGFKLKKITREELSEKMVLKMRTVLKLDDDQINAAFGAVMLAWERGSHCQIHCNPGTRPETYDFENADVFALCVHETDANMDAALEGYIAAGMTKFVLFSSTHASLLVALAGKHARLVDGKYVT